MVVYIIMKKLGELRRKKTGEYMHVTPEDFKKGKKCPVKVKRFPGKANNIMV